jgi:hypothetical protein
VLGGHSHSYERSFLIDGHYGTSGTLTSSMIVDGGSGRDAAPYVKPPGSESRAGAVYAVAGSSGQISGGSLDHPAMYTSMNVLGSVIVDVLTNQMRVTFLDSSAAVQDYFTIVKPDTVSTAPAAPTALTAKALSGGRITVQWADNSFNEDGFELERSIDGASFTLLQTVGANTTAYTDTGLSSGQRYYYRVRAFNGGGSSAYSNVANARVRR